MLLVPGSSTIGTHPRRVVNGQAVTFVGRLRSLPVPVGGKLVELQVRLSGHWQTFRTVRSDTSGAWRVRYRFRRSCGLLRYRFRARLPAESGYPFEAGRTRAIGVRVPGSSLPMTRTGPWDASRTRVGIAKVGPSRNGGHVIDRVRSKLSYANVMATLAVFISLGGTSYATLQLTGHDVRDGSLTGRDLRRNSLGGRPIKESRLGIVPHARNADRLDGVTAARLFVRCPGGTVPVSDVCVEESSAACRPVHESRQWRANRSNRRTNTGAAPPESRRAHDGHRRLRHHPRRRR